MRWLGSRVGRWRRSWQGAERGCRHRDTQPVPLPTAHDTHCTPLPHGRQGAPWGAAPLTPRVPCASPHADTRAGEGEAKGGRERRPGGCAPSRCSWQSALFPASSFSSSRLFRKLNIQLMAEWLRRALGALVPGAQAPLGTAPAVRRKRFLLLLLLLSLLLLLLLLPFLSSPHPLQVRGLRAGSVPPPRCPQVSPGGRSRPGPPLQ